MSGAREPSDEELVRRVRAGDESAAAILFDRHRPALEAKARRLLPARLRGKIGASDVVQESYLAAFAALGGFEDRGDGSFGAWLRQILKRKVLAEVERHLETKKRDARREVRLTTGAGGRGPAADATSPSGQFAAADEAHVLHAAIENLPSDYRTVLHLVYLEGLSMQAAAAKMDRSTEAVRKLYGRALARLAERLDRGSGSP